MTEPERRTLAELPSALTQLEQALAPMRGRQPVVFLDFDGTLSPIVQRPEDAQLLPGMREILQDLSSVASVAVVSGRDAADVRERVGLPRIACAGSHGFEVLGPGDRRHVHEGAEAYLGPLDRAESELKEALQGIDGCQIERKRFALAVHYRRVAEDEVAAVEDAVVAVASRHARLRRTGGKKIHELRPDLDWDKGRAVRWLMEDLAPDRNAVAMYIGDDVTDEDAFAVLAGQGVTIAVGHERRPTRARWGLADPAEVARFLEALTARIGTGRKEG
jgi:trehalose 6-phosphate phosphatase